ncbi:vacuolar protein sorting-associated protein 8, partial [Phenoliferia sp. Uapishka_3]
MTDLRTPQQHSNGLPHPSPWADEADEPQEDHRSVHGDYEGALKDVLGSETSHENDGEDPGDDQEEDEDDFGDFVYSGVDAPPPEAYQDRIKGVLGSDGAVTDDGLSSGDTPGGSTILNGTFKPHKVPRPNSESDFTSPGSPAPSHDTFPIGITPSKSIDSLASSTFPRRPAAHPQINRLRSTSTQLKQQNKISSVSTQSAFDHKRQAESPASSGFDLQSRRSESVVSNLHDLPTPSDLLSTNDPSSPGPASSSERTPSPTIKWTPLRRISTRLHSPTAKAGPGFTPAGATAAGLLGTPTVLAVSGIIAVGTSKGWVMVFDFGQNLRCVCGTEAIGNHFALGAKEAGAVTAVAISQDHTFVAAGHSLGSIHLYALTKPSQPARSVPPTTLPLILTGRAEGHLSGSRILHLGFVGARHTAIVSSDDTGLAFYHSLGKVLMLASTDIIRLLGRYPDPTSHQPAQSLPLPLAVNGVSDPPSSKPKKPSIILDMAPLPLGPSPHSTDLHSLIALLTPTKLVVVGLKPTPRTWWRATPPKEKHGEYSRNGVLAWYPSVPISSEVSVVGGKPVTEVGEDPLLAFAWGRVVRLVKMRRESSKDPAKGEKEPVKIMELEFVEVEGWESDGSVLGLQWYSERILFVLTPHHVDVYDILTRQRLGRGPHNIRNIVSHDHYASAFDTTRPAEDSLAYSSSFKSHKRKLFILTLADLRVGAVLSWADRILALMQPGTILDAIDVATSYLEGLIDASTIALPNDPAARREAVEPKLREILGASVEFVFSEERLRDGSHNDAEAMQRLFSGLVGTCVRACLVLGDIEWLFDELYERYETNGIEGIFLQRIEPFVLSGSVHALPPSVSQRLIAIHEDRGQYEAAQRIIWHVDPEYLDINQALGLCQRHKLYDALIYVYTRSMHDYVAPLVELLALVRRIEHHRRQRPRRVGDADDAPSIASKPDIEITVPDAYKIFAYLSHALAGLSYPSKDPLPYEESITSRNDIYAFLFSGQTLVWPQPGGRPVVTSEEEGSVEPLYPYIRLLLHFDAEAMLDALDLAFEEPYLEDDIVGKPVSRQRIVDLLLEIMAPGSDDFSPIDCTFLHIFIARNLPKYPQFIRLQPEVLQRILVGLATDADQSTTEDRQLAVEYLLSSFTPYDGDASILLFEHAGFFRILRSIYRGERRWADLATTYLRDPDVGGDIFGFLRETLKVSSRSPEDQRNELAEVILEAVPSLVQAHEAGLQETADLIDTYLPDRHANVIQRLSSSQWRQFAYLRCLLEPEESGASEVKDRAPSTGLDVEQQLLYLSLLCKHEPSHVLRFLENDTQRLSKNQEALRICENAEVFDALVWAMDRQGDTKAALDLVDDTLETRTDLLVQALMGPVDEEDEDDLEEDGPFTASVTADTILDQIAAISRVAIQICVARTSGPKKMQQTMTGEDLWFRLLSSLVSTVRAVRAVAPAPLRPSDRSSSHRRASTSSIIYDTTEPMPLSSRASDILSAIIPTALSSLVSTTSTREVSFPNLMRRLIESNSRSPAADRSYSEFKAIVTSMLDTYVFEGDLLELTSRISLQDLFEHVAALKTQRDMGWRARDEICADCGKPVWGPEGPGTSPPMSRSASVSMVVETMGMAGRPRMKKRPSLKGKEVEWPLDGELPEPQPILQPPKGIVVSQDGRVWHQACHLQLLGGGFYGDR